MKYLAVLIRLVSENPLGDLKVDTKENADVK